jgi:hypothetical protein
VRAHAGVRLLLAGSRWDGTRKLTDEK